MKNKFLFLVVVVAAVIAVPATTAIPAFAQTPPPLESNKPLLSGATTTEADNEKPTAPALGKIIIQISQTEQIVLDLPLKTDNKYQVAPIK